MQSLIAILLSIASLSTQSPVSLPNPILAARDSIEYGCTNTSFGRQEEFAWSITAFDFHASYTFTTPSHQNSWGYVNFNLSNPALSPAVATCQASSNQLTDFFYGYIPYSCSLPDGQIIGGGTGGQATFDFNRPTGLLNLNQSWVCRDQDPRWPIFFTAYGQANLSSLECTTTYWQNPNWTQGEIYSDRRIECAPVDLTLKPSQITAIA